jgi:hypothetical protein
MAAILPLLPGLIALIPTITTGLSSLIAFIASIRTAAKQTSEWTPELEALFVNALIAKASTDAWKTDSEIAASK